MANYTGASVRELGWNGDESAGELKGRFAVPKWVLDPPKPALWASTFLVATLGLADFNEARVSKWLLSHKLLDFTGALPYLIAMTFVINEAWVRLAATANRDAWIRIQRKIWNKFGGNLDEINRFRTNGGGQLTEENARSEARSLLSRAQEIAQFVYSDVGDFRCACLVEEPISASGQAGGKRFLRAWQYDTPYADARHSRVAVGDPLAGYVFMMKKPCWVSDTNSSDCESHFREATYRSIIAFPIMVGGPRGKCLGVLSITHSDVGTFDDERLARRFMAMLTPILATLAIVLDLKNRAHPYAFPG